MASERFTVSTNGYRLARHYIYRSDAMFRKLCVMLADVTPRQYAAINLRVQRLHSPVQYLREAGQVLDMLRTEMPAVVDGSLRTARADEFVPAVVQRAREAH